MLQMIRYFFLFAPPGAMTGRGESGVEAEKTNLQSKAVNHR